VLLLFSFSFFFFFFFFNSEFFSASVGDTSKALLKEEDKGMA
jgi:hypothetical protein